MQGLGCTAITSLIICVNSQILFYEEKYCFVNPFYHFLKGPRAMQLGSVDIKLHTKETKAIKRKQKYQKFAQKVEDQLKSQMQSPLEDSSSGEDADDVNDPSVLYETPTCSQVQSPRDDGTIALTLPKKELLSKTADVATRCGISHRAHVALTAKLVKVGGGELAATTLSVSTSHRHRRKATQEAATTIREKFYSLMPKHLVVHWDGKVIKYAHGTDDRLAIIVSNPCNPPLPDQFLAAPCIPNSTGQTMANAILDTLQQWHIPKEVVIGTCWDTTASNTGCHEGSATLFDQAMEKASLWLACRHHIGELHIKHADSTRATTKGPTDPLFEKFREVFDNLPQNHLKLWDGAGDNSRPFTWLRNQSNEVLIWGTEQLLAGTFPREDYRELLELTVHYLGGEVMRPRVNGPPQPGFRMRRPGALHHARFMAKGLYILKIAMLSDVLPQDVLPANKHAGITRMAQFIVLFYTRYYLMARLPTAAPQQDLTLWKSMGMYQMYDRQLSVSVKASIKRHQWYLTEQLVVFCLFDKDISNAEKAAVSAALRAQRRPPHFELGRPTFPNNRLYRGEPTLASFVGPNSYLAFELLGNDSAWLALDPMQWEADQRFLHMAEVIRSISVVNDTAERCVKAVQEFANSAQDGDYRGDIILVSNSHRFKIPSFSKNEMEENI